MTTKLPDGAWSSTGLFEQPDRHAAKTAHTAKPRLLSQLEEKVGHVLPEALGFPFGMASGSVELFDFSLRMASRPIDIAELFGEERVKVLLSTRMNPGEADPRAPVSDGNRALLLGTLVPRCARVAEAMLYPIHVLVAGEPSALDHRQAGLNDRADVKEVGDVIGNPSSVVDAIRCASGRGSRLQPPSSMAA
jgi:hypothetical protein